MTPQSGQAAELTAPPLSDTAGEIHGTKEELLLQEYHWLNEGLRYGRLTPEQKARIAQVETEMDDLDAQSPGAQYMRQQMRRLETYFDELEAKIKALPDVKQA